VVAERLAALRGCAVAFGAQRLLDHVGERVVVPADAAGLHDAAGELGGELVVEVLELQNGVGRARCEQLRRAG
jgi:hypothetical protein